MNRAIPALTCVLALSGCVTMRPIGEAVPLEQVIRQLKHDIGEYNVYAAEHANDPRLHTVCGGKIDLKVTAATISVTTSAKTDQGFTAGAEITPGPVLSKVGVNASTGRTVENSQTLTFTIEPLPGGEAGQAVTAAASPHHSDLYSVLTNLRESLLRASDTAPCLHFPEKQDNSVEFGFTATSSASTGGGINLFIFAIGASRTDERTAANTIKIAFEGQGQAFIQ